jgi:hypothetical protein
VIKKVIKSFIQPAPDHFQSLTCGNENGLGMKNYLTYPNWIPSFDI